MGSSYNGDALEAVRTGNDITDVVSGYVRLERKGKRFFGLCPFHAEKTPSFSVDPEKQFFYCFSCNKGGDVFKFVQEIERVDFAESLRRLAARAHVALPEDARQDPEQARRKALRERVIAMNEDAALLFAQALGGPGGQQARDYLRRRAVPSAAANRFGLGYAPAGWGALHGALLAKGYSEEEQVLGGLAAIGKSGAAYDRFRNRIMFPIRDVAGRVVGFGGRALEGGEPKYLNSPETPAFTKGRTLYGLDLAKAARDGRMYIVEGYMDCVSLVANGIGNVVASLGTALTEEQGKLLRRFADEAVIAFDTDAAGKAAALRGLDILDGLGFSVKVLRLPSGKDPDEYVLANGAAAFRGLLGGARTLVEYKIDMAREANPGEDMDSRVRFLRDVVKTLAGLGSVVEREMYAKAVAQRYGVSDQAILDEIRAEQRKGAGKPRQTLVPASVPAVAHASVPAAANASVPAVAHASVPAVARTAVPAVAPTAVPAVARTAVHVAAHGSAPAAAQSSAPASANASALALAAAREPQMRDDDELFVLALLSVDNGLWEIVGRSMPPASFENGNAARAASYAAGRFASGAPVGACELMPFFAPAEADRFAAILAQECHPEDHRRAMAQKIVDIEFARGMRGFREACERYDDGGSAGFGRDELQAMLAAQRDGIRRGRLFQPAKYGRV